MNIDAFTSAYNESRNGANGFYRHWAVRSFQFSDGVHQCAEAGCMWLIDIIPTEFAKPLRTSGEVMGIVKVVVADNAATITMTVADDAPPLHTRHVEYTDMPAGEWTFFLADEQERFALILPKEY